MQVPYKKRNKKLKPIGIDIFSGAGGLSVGFEQAGFDIRYAIECDKYAAETYRNNRKNKNVTVDIRDIREIPPKEVINKLGIKKGELDIVIGGPPCQGFSISNMKTRNLDNPKNQLIFKFVEFVKALKPKWFLMENVAGLDSFEKGLFRDTLVEMFQNTGYKTESIILNAANFAVPQNRNRIFFIGNRVGNSIDFIEKLKKMKIEKHITVNDAISDLPSLENGHNINIKPYRYNRKLTAYQSLMRSGMNGKVCNNFVSKSTDLALKRYRHIMQGENLLILAKRRPSLVANYKNVGNCHHWIYLRLSWDKPSVALNNYRKNMLIHPDEDRGLSVREAARLQSFPDNYLFYGPLGYQQQQVANAVPPLLVNELAGLIRWEM